MALATTGLTARKRGEKLTPRLLWENVKPQLKASETGYILCDDTVMDKRYSASIELTREQ